MHIPDGLIIKVIHDVINICVSSPWSLLLREGISGRGGKMDSEGHRNRPGEWHALVDFESDKKTY
jgi:hypothetical protein